MRPRMLVLGGPSARLPDALKLSDSFDPDAAAILKVPADAFHALARTIAEHPGFLSQQQLRQLLRERWDDAEGAKRAANYAVVLDSILRRTRSTLAQFFNSFEAGIKERSSFTEEEKQELVRRSRLLVLEDSALARQWRAESLATETDHPLQDLQFRCALHPVLDEARSSVRGMVPIITMGLEVVDANGLPTWFETQMTAEDLKELADKVAQAQQELETLHAMLAATQMPVPQLNDPGDGEEEN